MLVEQVELIERLIWEQKEEQEVYMFVEQVAYMLVEPVVMVEYLIWEQKEEQEEEYRIEDQVEMIESLIQVV
jgi:hypothetical protein